MKQAWHGPRLPELLQAATRTYPHKAATANRSFLPSLVTRRDSVGVQLSSAGVVSRRSADKQAQVMPRIYTAMYSFLMAVGLRLWPSVTNRSQQVVGSVAS